MPAPLIKKTWPCTILPPFFQIPPFIITLIISSFLLYIIKQGILSLLLFVVFFWTSLFNQYCLPYLSGLWRCSICILSLWNFVSVLRCFSYFVSVEQMAVILNAWRCMECFFLNAFFFVCNICSKFRKDHDIYNEKEKLIGKCENCDGNQVESNAKATKNTRSKNKNKTKIQKKPIWWTF